MKETKNKIALQSREWIVTSLLELMREKKFCDITISEITDNAELSRRTFYRSFSSKEDVIVYHLNTIWNEELPLLFAEKDDSYYSATLCFLQLWYRHRELALLLYSNNLIPMLLKELNNIFQKIYLKRKGNYPLAKQEDAMRYALAYSAGGLLSVLCQWASEGMTKKPEEIVQLLMKAYEQP